MLPELFANIICVLHALFLAWMAFTPFTSNEPMLVLHAIVTPFLWFHWWINSDVCALTLAEQYLRGVESKESFFYNLVSPIYKIEDEHIRQFSWVASLVLWLVTISKIYAKPSMIKAVFMPWKNRHFHASSSAEVEAASADVEAPSVAAAGRGMTS